MAFEAVVEYPGRVVASSLGVFWGTAAVIVLLSWGAGFQAYMHRELGSFGQSLVMMYPAATSSGFPGFRKGQPVRVSRQDAAAVERNASHRIEAVLAQQMSRGRVLVEAGPRTRRLDLTGVDHRWAGYRNFQMGHGRFFDRADVARRRPVAILGHDAARDLFGSPGAAIGAILRVDGHPFRVLGVAAMKGRQYMNTNRPDNRMLMIPITTAESALGYDDEAVGNLLVYPRPGVGTDEAVEAVLHILGPRAGFHAEDEDAFKWFDLAQFLDLIDLFHAGFSGFIGLAGLITLLIGAVGIANYHLAILAERTMEVAVAKAVGAKDRWLVRQTLLESVLVSGAATLGGVLLGLGLCAALVQWTPPALPKPILSGSVVAVTAVAILGVAVVSAILPARRIREIDTAAALRSDL
ncbi:MAG: ABC transporter permease [bacterium]|nr:ABC transporter permease [bacterium]